MGGGMMGGMMGHHGGGGGGGGGGGDPGMQIQMPASKPPPMQGPSPGQATNQMPTTNPAQGMQGMNPQQMSSLRAILAVLGGKQ